MLSFSTPTRAIFLIAAVKFVFILDFMMPMPLGPDLVRALRFPAESLGWVSATYTAASMLAGLLAIRWLDRFERRKTFLLCFGLMALFTLLTAMANNLLSLLVLRALTGFAGCPAIAVGMAIIIDLTPPEKRGRTIACVMMGFSLAAVAGVPLALELAQRGGWSLPFITVGGLGLLVWMCGWYLLPALPPVKKGQHRVLSPLSLLAQPQIRAACLIQAGSQFCAFLVVPHFSAFLILNQGVPRESLGLLYLLGGLAAMLTVQILGRMTDRYGALRPALLTGIATVIGLSPWLGWAGLPVALVFICFMAGNAGRGVALAALTSTAPAAHERGGYLALESLVQDFSITVAALVASVMLGSASEGALTGTASVAGLALLTLIITLSGVARQRLGYDQTDAYRQ
ncbi:MAG: MFS transporter [Hahellaceae bacterium]|nr:MFS transporter [Hahellaceae bacterium]